MENLHFVQNGTLYSQRKEISSTYQNGPIDWPEGDPVHDRKWNHSIAGCRRDKSTEIKINHKVGFFHRYFDTDIIENCKPKFCDIFWLLTSLVFLFLLGTCTCISFRILEILSEKWEEFLMDFRIKFGRVYDYKKHEMKNSAKEKILRS